MTLTLYNTRSKKPEQFRPNDPTNITIYTCGPTVYDDAHIGNFRSFLAADLLRRFLESPLCRLANDTDSNQWTPRTVTHVMNITDVGHMTDDDNADGAGLDKMELAAQRLLEAKKAGTLHQDADLDPSDPFQIARFYTQRFKEDAKKLGLKVVEDAERAAQENADDEQKFLPRATDHVNDMKRVIAALLTSNHAYTAGEPGARAVYFNVSTFPDYGTLSGNTLDKLQSGAGGRVTSAAQSEKRNPADFLLWKEDNTHTMKWPAPNHPDCQGWDQGYPGWHIECTAMALKRLVDTDIDNTKGKTIDIHTGGEDNIFPHHECEIAQSCAFTGVDHFARHWFHPRFLQVDGQKMSKSKGTMYTLRDLEAQGHDPAAVRLELIKTHYRANADFSLQGLKDSARTIERWRRFLESATNDTASNDDPIRDEFAAALHDDLNIAGAIGALNGWIKRTPNPTTHDAETLKLFDHVLGVIAAPRRKSQDTGIALYTQGVEPSNEIETLLAQRADAKKNKDFKTADQIRDQLAAMNLAIADKPGGKVEVSRAT